MCPTDKDCTFVEADTFRGHAQYSDLSWRIVTGQEVTEACVRDVLGAEAVPAFALARACCDRRVRVTTDEPALAHPADMCLRAHSLGYRGIVLPLCLLHDLVEDTSATLSDVRLRLQELGRFGPRVGRGVHLLTNRYALLLRQIAPRIRSLAFAPASLQSVAREVARERSLVEDAARGFFQHEFARLLDWLAWDIDLETGRARAARDCRYDLAEDLRLRSYVLYILDQCDAARSSPSAVPDDAVLIVKTLDACDNLRTMDYNRPFQILKTVDKVETLLDVAFDVRESVARSGMDGATFHLMYDYLKATLLQQLLERRRALRHSGEKRVSYGALVLDGLVARVAEKYHLADPPVATLRQLENLIREANLASAGASQ